MGWFWTNSDSAHPTSSVSTNAPESTSRSLPCTPSSSSLDASPLPISQPPSGSDLAEQELQSFLRELEADARPSSSIYSRVPRAPQPTDPITRSDRDDDEPLSEQLLPTTMSCRVAFDEAFYCNSFGGRFNDLYRYGGLQSCSDSWKKFWFCMRTRGYSGMEKQAAIKEHYRRTETMKYAKSLGKESSEEIWKSRDKKVEWGEAFSTPFEDFEGSDEEWNRQQQILRSKIRG